MRAEIPIVVIEPDGDAVQGATVRIDSRETGALATVYQFETGSQVYTNPLTSDATGHVEGWLERGAYTATISAPTLGARQVHFEISPTRTGAIDTPWLADSAVTAAKIAAGAVTAAKLAAGVAAANLGADSITSAMLGAGVVGADEIADASITAAELAPNAVTTAKIQDGAVTGAKIAGYPADASKALMGDGSWASIATKYAHGTGSATGNGVPSLSLVLDNDGMWSAGVPSRLTIKTAGIWVATIYATNPGDAHWVDTNLRKNGGSVVKASGSSGGGGFSASAMFMSQCAVNDYFDCTANAWNNSEGTYKAVTVRLQLWKIA